jgi:hypothetical protein
MLHFGEMIGRLSRKLHSIAKPELTIITHGEGITINPSEVARRELSSIGWINIWGPGFVHERHESLFLNVPGYKTARLKGGSIYHQSAKTMIVQSANEAKSLRKSIVEYFRRNGFAVKYHGSIVLKERKG